MVALSYQESFRDCTPCASLTKTLQSGARWERRARGKEARLGYGAGRIQKAEKSERRRVFQLHRATQQCSDRAQGKTKKRFRKSNTETLKVRPSTKDNVINKSIFYVQLPNSKKINNWLLASQPLHLKRVRVSQNSSPSRHNLFMKSEGNEPGLQQLTAFCLQGCKEQ